MAKRIRTTVTVREDDPVPRQRRRKSSNTIVIVILLVLFGLFLLNRTQQNTLHPQPVSRPR